MIIKELYDKITLVNPCNQATFLSHYDTSVRAILARYNTKYVVLPGAVYLKPVNINDDSPVFEEYMNAIYDNILFLLTGNGDRKTDYVAEADDAYKHVWTAYMKDKTFVDEKAKRCGNGLPERVIEKPVVHVDHEVEAFTAQAVPLTPGSIPTVTYENHTFTFGIPQGFKGESGNQGERGVPGERGPQGMTGPEGRRGPQGERGIRGERGPAGPQGPRGPSGQEGQPGTDGQNGVDGADGVTFTPSVSSAGVISWTNDGGRTNPSSVDLVAAVLAALPSAVGVSF